MTIRCNSEQPQKIEYDITTVEGAARITVATGTLPSNFQAFSAGTPLSQSVTIKALLDPTLTPCSFCVVQHIPYCRWYTT
jgi:hypothetical protein